MSTHPTPRATANRPHERAGSTAQHRQDPPLLLVPAAVPDRCAAAHARDPRPCEGATDAVQIVDQTAAATAACLLHGAVLLASLDRARVYPLGGLAGCAITVYVRARSLPPFDFLTDPGTSRMTTVARSAPRLAGAHADACVSGGWCA